VYLGNSEAAIEHFERSLRLSPIDPINFNSYVGIGAAHVDAGRYDEAVKWIEKGLRERPDAVWAYRQLASAYANAGRLQEARDAVATLLRTYPNVTISQLLALIPATPDYISRYAEGLRKAGLPE
jgi:adenylate cyclase